MRLTRRALFTAILGSFVLCLILSANSRPIHVLPLISGGDLIPGGMGLTLKNTTAGCDTGCHSHFKELLVVNGANNIGLKVVTDGPLPGSSALVAAGSTGTFAMNIGKYGCEGSPFKLGIVIAASDGTLAPFDSTLRTYQALGELTHTLVGNPLGAPIFQCNQNNNSQGTAQFKFNYTVPAGAIPGSAHKLWGVVRSSPGGFTWSDLSTDANGNTIAPTTVGSGGFNVIVPLGTSGPTSLTQTHTDTSVTLTWSGGTAPFYRVIYKQGNTPPAGPNQNGALTQDTKQNTLTISAQAATTYSFAVYGRSELKPGFGIGDFYYSSNSQTITVTTNATPPPPPLPTLPLTGTMAAARFGHTATLLYNGKVLVAGGQNASGSLSSAELYDPAKGVFSSTGNMTHARSGHTATPLTNGKILIAGGTTDGSAELYDPVTETFTSTGSMLAVRSGHTATPLSSGKVLIAGGTTATASGELYDQSNGTFSGTSNGMQSTRFGHTATLLSNDTVLIAGGSATSGGTALQTTDLYNPSNNSFAAGPTLNAPRKDHTATAINRSYDVSTISKVLFVGGSNDTGALQSDEFYNGPTNTFDLMYDSNGNPASARTYASSKHTAALLGGSVLITGGSNNSSSALITTETGFVANCNGCAVTATGFTLHDARARHTATLLTNGKILFVGGTDAANNALASAEIYPIPNSNVDLSQGSGPTMTAQRYAHTATLLPNGKILLTGGGRPSSPDGCTYEWNTAELYDQDANLVGGAFTASAATMSDPRVDHTATLLRTGKVLVAGGFWSCNATTTGGHRSSADSYDPGNDTFTPTGSMLQARRRHTATLLTNGKVLIAGGEGRSGNQFVPLTSAELYDPGTGTFTATGSLTTARYYHTATLLNNGKVLIAGGTDGTLAGSGQLTGLSSVELYDPATGLFTPASNLLVSRQGHTAVLLPDGRVFIAGGAGGTLGFPSDAAQAELYNPDSGTFAAANCCGVGRLGGTASVMSDGQVLLFGGYSEYGDSGIKVYNPNTDSTLDHSTLGPRKAHTATPARNGSILIAGGIGTNAAYLDSTEIYSVPMGDYQADNRRPAISSKPSIIYLPTTLTVTGTRFRGDTETSSGNSQNSPTNFPLLQLQRVDNNQISWILPSAYSDTSFLSTTIDGLADGYYRVVIITAGNSSLGVATNNSTPITNSQTLMAIKTLGASAVTMSSSANPSSYGTSVTITANVFPPAATGTITFKEGPTTLATQTISNGSASFSTASLGAGDHTITALYSGDDNFQPSTSGQVTQTVNKASTTTTLTSSANPSATSQSVTFTATVSPSTATGSVTFTDGATTLGTGSLSGGTASLSTSSLTAGTHSITATYGGNANYLTSASTPLSQTVSASVSPTTTALVSSAPTSTYGQSVTFTATVSPTNATGSITFNDGVTTLSVVPLAAGSAAFSTSALTGGMHSITAVYGGDSSHSGSTSNAVAQTVNPASTTTALSPSANPSTFGQSVTFTATVSPSAATGTVTFKDGVTTLGTGSLSSGTATFSTSSLTAGSHSITAVYSGDTNYTTSTSAITTQTVNKASTTTTLTSSANPSATAQTVTFTATISPSTATGTVTFTDGATTLGAPTIVSGTATLSTSSLTAGDHPITATYNGDANNLTSSSAVLHQIVSATLTASSTTVVSSSPTSNFEQSVTFTATVTPAAATGTMTFKDGATTLGTGTLSGGSATFNTSSLSVGTHSITAGYGGDATYAASTSPPITQTVNSVASPPTVTDINPNKGSASGGTNVTLTGTGFQSGATVTIGGTAATNVIFVSATSLTARTPSHVAGAVNVTVTNPDTLSGTLTSGFTYVPSGDTNGDGTVSVPDIFYLINYVFAGGPPPVAGDANGDGQVSVADVFYLINYLFAGGPVPK